MKPMKILNCEVGLGCAPLSGTVLANGLYGNVAKDESIHILRAAHAMGIRRFDVAPLYGHGEGERRVAQGLSPINRQDQVISTKVGRLVSAKPHSKAAVIKDDWSYRGVIHSVEASLYRLNTDYLDIVYVHDPDLHPNGEDTSINESIPALNHLKKHGIIKNTGSAMNQSEMLLNIIRASHVDHVLIAGQYSLLRQNAALDLIPYCKDQNIFVTVGGPFNSGILARDMTTPVSFDYQPAHQAIIDKATRIAKICREYQVPLAAAALQYIVLHPDIKCVIPGAEKVSELEQNIHHVGIDIPRAFWQQLYSDGFIEQRCDLLD